VQDLLGIKASATAVFAQSRSVMAAVSTTVANFASGDQSSVCFPLLGTPPLFFGLLAPIV
jgi:hypothetical protein